jgi:phosphotransferase system HPr (HPr) family protein
MTAREVFEIQNRLGLHARAAVLLVQLAKGFEAEVTVIKDGESVSGKSILSLMTLAAAKGCQVEVVAEGADAEAAVKAIGELIARRFDEED